MTSTSDVVLEERDGPVAVVRLHRPEARNAMNEAMRRQIVRTFRSLDADDDVRAIVLTGSDPAFSAGADMKETTAAGQRRAERTNPAQAVRACETPVIAAVNGSCVTGGLEVALSCAFIVASTRASFADTHARIGLIPGWGLSALLPRAIGIRRAREMMATGNFVSAEFAERIGLVNHVVEHDALLETAISLARDVAATDAAALRRTFQLLDQGDGSSLAHALGLEADAAAVYARPRQRTAELLDSAIDRGSKAKDGSS